ncbi:transcription-repair coupling factor [Pokkaliibacter plantistimulans]|uniref:Transcription-repair-coupling factor n=1 Tax=Proteobacteria bacterium 228 TaxID=2083153 RepID=A0A2S5KNV6_9PROT|nr:transcription-repair coupling factor [Pokkaliibacter plantistimulans]PPC76353.1 transcription-repair coupling factor [Pokkaliibacter plantistimulans]
MSLLVDSLALPSKAGELRFIGELQGAAPALLCADLVRQHKGLVVVLTNTPAQTQSLEEELRFLLAADEQRYPVLTFPDWETLPYDRFSPHQDIISHRLEALFRLPSLQQGVLILPLSTLLQRLSPVAYLDGYSLQLRPGQRFDFQTYRQRLEQAGYRAVDTVYEHGEYAIRGAIMDIFPMGSPLPLRVELFDDEIDTLRSFDPQNQRTLTALKEVHLLPARECPLDDKSISRFRQRWRERFDVDPRQCSVYEDVSHGLAPPGIEYYLPLFFDQTSTLFDFLPEQVLLCRYAGLQDRLQQTWTDIEQRYDELSHDIRHPILKPTEIYLPPEQLNQLLNQHPGIELSLASLPDKAGRLNAGAATPPALTIDARAERPYAALQQFVDQHNDWKLLICAESAGRREALQEHLHKAQRKASYIDGWEAFLGATAGLYLTVAPLQDGLLLASRKVALISEAQLFGLQVRQARRRQKSRDDSDQVILSLTELSLGAPIVHIDHGVGRYKGLTTLEIEGQQAEFLMLEYADEAKLYVPVSSLHLISRYTGASEELAPLNKLGSDQWQKIRQKAAEKVRDTAAELLDVYARRAARKGFPFTASEVEYAQFSGSFPFEETPDQQSAISAVLDDMKAAKPMDRLVCGDVGFGKTEVAMRAAFVATLEGKQVAVLVPTTLLAQQHYESFRDRFADWPIRIEVLSRFRSSKEVDQTLQAVAEGKVDILVGTHKILQQDVKYKDLGLVIIDEEHRFGVQQKEKLKALRANVDILTLTATPIPRTLNMAMSGLRDLSIIATPPARRLSIKTFVRESDERMIKEAILRELLRGGQVYYLHNEVKTIEKTAQTIRELIPEARVAVGHGQMRERELEQVMSDFYHRRFNVLVCTTIIETGIDVPNANTIIIDRADKFGLAQLHQLRGRVGRSHHQAYAYLLTPPWRTMTPDAQKRLEAISGAEHLGAGFTLATHDLEIRGAGELLGEEQSGQIHSIGFSLYMDMLDRAVKAIRQGKAFDLEKPLNLDADVNLRLPALIPDDYLPDVNARLILYKRIANATDEDQLRELQVEMIDRFGLLPEQVKNLFRQTELKLKATTLGVVKIEANQENGQLEFAHDTKVDPFKLVQLVQRQSQRYRLQGTQKLRFTQPMANADKRFKAVEELLDALAP